MSIINRILTKNYKQVPLLRIDFNYQKFRKQGKDGSCQCVYHPAFRRDKKLQKMFDDMVEHIRDTYDMKKLL